MSDWANIDNLSSEELNSALMNDIAKLDWGWGDAPADTKPKAEAWDWEEAPTEPTDPANADDENLSKPEKKIKKLLWQRNEEKDKNITLENRIKELEKQNADNKFYTSNPDAETHKEAIDKLIEERGFTRDEAYLITANKDILADNRTATAWNRWIVWTTPWANLRDKKPNDMSLDELNVTVREMEKAWTIGI